MVKSINILFVFLFALSFVAAVSDGDSVCFPQNNYIPDGWDYSVDSEDILCTNVFILGDNYYCDIDDYFICENGCSNGACVGVEEPECSSGHMKCESDAVYECVDNEWLIDEVCPYGCISPMVQYSYCASVPDPAASFNYSDYQNTDTSTLYTGSEYRHHEVCQRVNFAENVTVTGVWFDFSDYINYAGDNVIGEVRVRDYSSDFSGDYLHEYWYFTSPYLEAGDEVLTYIDFDRPEYGHYPFVAFGVTDFCFKTSGNDPSAVYTLSPVGSNSDVAPGYFCYYYGSSAADENSDFTCDTGKDLYFNITFEEPSSAPYYNVSEGGSCGFLPDGGPFCGESLSCDYFQCVFTNDPTCASVGGNVCVASECSTGLYFENTIENWCCNGNCSDITFGSVGDWCNNDSVCEPSLSCILYRCEDPSNVTNGSYSDFCNDTYPCQAGLVCNLNDYGSGRCNYNVTSWLTLPSECTAPNDVPCNNHGCAISALACGLSGAVGIDCTYDGFMINYYTGKKESCQRYNRFVNSLSSLFPDSPLPTLKLVIIVSILFSWVSLMFSLFIKIFPVFLTLSYVGVTLILFFFSSISYISRFTPFAFMLIGGFALYSFLSGGGS